MVVEVDPRAADAAARLGQVLKDKWRLDELLGVGGMAAVYAATHRNGKRVAIKMLHREYSLDGEVKSRFLREGYLVNKVEHPGVVQVLDDDASEEGAAFIVMDLLEGESLEARRLRKGGYLPPAEVLSAADQVLDVLVAAHAVEMVHRDLKPENLFLCKDGTVKLLDFGIARLRELSARIGATLNGGTTMGTPAFMPPEQARGNWTAVDNRTDLWALGATMYTMLTGTIVHEANTIGELLIAAMTKHALPLSARMPGAPALLASVVDRALAFEPADRWPDARAMQAAVREAYRDAVGRAAASPPALAVSLVDQPAPVTAGTWAPPDSDGTAEQVTKPRATIEELRAEAEAASAARRAPQRSGSGTAAMPAMPADAPPPGAFFAPRAVLPPSHAPLHERELSPPPGRAPPLPFVGAEQAPPQRTSSQALVLLAAGALLSALLGVLGIALIARLREGPTAPSAEPATSAAPTSSASASASAQAPAKSSGKR